MILNGKEYPFDMLDEQDLKRADEAEEKLSKTIHAVQISGESESITAKEFRALLKAMIGAYRQYLCDVFGEEAGKELVPQGVTNVRKILPIVKEVKRQIREHAEQTVKEFLDFLTPEGGADELLGNTRGA